jgi:hypothetical protein
MPHLSHLPLARPFPSALGAVRKAFAAQPDDQTCGAAAIRHGLLLGGLSVATAALEAVLDIRRNQGTPPAALRACLRALGLEPRALRKARRTSTAAFLDGLRQEFERGAFLLPCIGRGEHWVCVGAWRGGRAAVVDSFFGDPFPSLASRGRELPEKAPALGFFRLSAEDLDALDWAHHVTLVRPGRWRAEYEAWLPARLTLLRAQRTPVTVAEAARLGAHRCLEAAPGARGLALHLSGGAVLRFKAGDVGMEPAGEALLVRRLAGALEGPAAPELVVRVSALCGAHLVAGAKAARRRASGAA